MSAKLDRSQDVRFYFGNAARDLADLIPAWDEELFIKTLRPISRVEPTIETIQVADHIHASVDFGMDVQALEALQAPSAELFETLERCQELGEQIEQKQRLLGFLIKDLKRMLA